MFPVIPLPSQPTDEKQGQPPIPLAHDGGCLVVRGVCKHPTLVIAFSQASGGVL
jgi:hypothetical protein